MNVDSLEKVAAWYRRFAELEARGISPLYEELAGAVADSEQLLEFIARLPETKQQPNLVFGAVRYLFGAPKDSRHLRELIRDNGEAIRAVVLRRSTQTNEPARCATLLPVLASLPQPLALLEVGAAAGLCLLPDYYGYEYGDRHLEPKNSAGAEAPTFNCAVEGNVPVPTHMPDIIWRAGLDLNPVDVSDVDACRWLEALVWPEQEGRAERLKRAIAIARKTDVPIKKADLLEGVPAVAETAPRNSTLVVLHSAVLAYVGLKVRHKFAETVRKIGAVWVSNEGVGVLPWLEGDLQPAKGARSFLLSVDEKPVALTGPHGQYIRWL